MFKSWCDLAEEFDLSLSDYDMRLLHLTKALAKRWELAERVVAVTHGLNIMELITRVRTRLAIILVKAGPGIKIYFQKVADLGLVEMVQLNADAVEGAAPHKPLLALFRGWLIL